MTKDEDTTSEIKFRFGKTWYYWSGWLGCQLHSSEWRRVPAGTTRRLYFEYGSKYLEVTVYSDRRNLFTWHTCWSVSDRGTLDEHIARVKELQTAIRNMV